MMLFECLSAPVKYLEFMPFNVDFYKIHAGQMQRVDGHGANGE
jgi:hypothetical protein